MSGNKSLKIKNLENCLCQTPEKLANDLCREASEAIHDSKC